jgi:hypothetical protein
MNLTKLLGSERIRYFGIRLLFLFTVVSILTADYAQFSSEFIGPGHDAYTANIFVGDDYDIPPLLLRAHQCTSIIQTRSYWHEDYTPGIPFYRPLSLTWFWAEYHAFSSHYYNRWTVVSIVLGWLFCALFGLLVRNLTGSNAAALCTLLIFAGSRFPPMSDIFQFLFVSQDPPGLVSVLLWKDQPTILCDCAVAGALLCARSRKWIPALLLAVISVLFKEAGWVTYPLVLLMLVFYRMLPKVPWWVYVGAIICIAVPMLARYLSGMGLIGGYRVGHNYEWKVRYLYAVVGSFFQDALHGRWAAGILGFGLYGVFRWKHKSLLLRCSAVAALTILTAIVTAAVQKTTFLYGLVITIDPSMQMPTAVLLFIFAVGLGSLLRYKDLTLTAAFLVVCSFIAAFGYAAALQVNIHALEMCYACQAGAAGCGLTACFRALREWLLSFEREVIQNDPNYVVR